MNERPIPKAALEDENSVEMLRVWIAKRGLHCSMKVGMYRETTNISEEKAWGVILADAARNIADALHSGYGVDAKTALHLIQENFHAELDDPTSSTKGGFVNRNDA
ncbi:DUF5076 domain-containing protein [Stenotrophomonas sp. SI-NJAU-1]|jgi:hypothetical protein|uniref:DUF5076 domain-containing protein n=1 Tax=Stenotrophomonas TaxID=40323 RepID=UPI001AA1519C|nr:MULTISPECIES: DUF5076 domain-containing protein [Stenotrophomonas]MBO1748479.1 DUF5076 domain-containing protein [Stenotrophomonas indicatrix]MDN8643961.1 DUF5076 domain-containing protein [Stenotrophomonas indicatrix]MDN8656658.1 DUF5076 domain-containing protein [Stenotrophomonas indicatrix]UEX19213.1 DUF5076 domain-containing protein [Stenotrophomonas sp. SI-NJAU-1]